MNSECNKSLLKWKLAKNHVNNFIQVNCSFVNILFLSKYTWSSSPQTVLWTYLQRQTPISCLVSASTNPLMLWLPGMILHWSSVIQLCQVMLIKPSRGIAWLKLYKRRSCNSSLLIGRTWVEIAIRAFTHSILIICKQFQRKSEWNGLTEKLL